MSNFNERLIRAAKLDVSLYEEVESDEGALGQAMGVVVLSSLAAGIGTIKEGGPGIILWILIGTVLALLGWYIWAYVIYFVGTKWLPEPQTKADPGQLLRTIGFSSSPGIVRILCVIPKLTGIVLAVSSIWMLVAMVIAVRQALDYSSTLRAMGVCLVGWIVQILFFLPLIFLIGNILK